MTKQKIVKQESAAALVSDFNSYCLKHKTKNLRRILLSVSAACVVLVGAASVHFQPTLRAAEAPLRIKALSYHTFEEQDVRDTASQTIDDVLERMQENAAAFISQHYAKVSEEDALEIVHQAFISGKEHDIDPLLILAIIATESSFNPNAGSSAGAKGLMQVHAKVHAKRFKEYGGVKAVHEIEAGIEVGTQILKEYLNKTGSLKGALKYYVGAANHKTDGGYSRKVLSMRSHLQMAANGEIQAARIQARSPSKFPEDHQDHKDFATYSANMKLEKFPSLAGDSQNQG